MQKKILAGLAAVFVGARLLERQGAAASGLQ